VILVLSGAGPIGGVCASIQSVGCVKDMTGGVHVVLEAWEEPEQYGMLRRWNALSLALLAEH
jgi:hypothetical protein